MSDKNSYKRIEMFYKYNIAIKKIIFSLRPFEFNDEEFYQEYKVKTIEKIDELKKYFDDLLELFDFPESEKKYVEYLFEKYQEELSKTKLDINNLDNFYHKNIYGIDKQLTKDVRHQTYAIGGSSLMLLPKAKTINELLFIIHCMVNNDLNLYQNIPLISTKDKVSLRGETIDLAEEIYNSLYADITPGFIEIVSLKRINKILMLISKRGHATTVEITQNDDIIDVSYFIPRLYNREMINNLHGVTHVTENDYYAIGTFRCHKDDASSKIIDLINGVPTDKYMFLEKNTITKQGL